MRTLTFFALLTALFSAVSAAAKPPATAQILVARLDGTPVYHWRSFPSRWMADDVDRTLVLRAFRRNGFHLARRFVDDSLRYQTDKGFGGSRERLVASLREHGASLEDYRRFLAEELIIVAMLNNRNILRGAGQPQLSQEEWLAGLRQGTRVERLSVVRSATAAEQ